MPPPLVAVTTSMPERNYLLMKAARLDGAG